MRRNIQVVQHSTTTIQLTDDQRNQIAIEQLLETNNLNDEHFREDGFLVEWENERGRVSRNRIRKPTEQNNAGFDAINLIQEHQKKLAESDRNKTAFELERQIKSLQGQLEQVNLKNTSAY